jgi:uncharacterized protein involved in exopolysaccharide biosynthesis
VTTDLWRALSSRWWFVAITALAALAAGLAWSLQRPASYTASATVIVQPATSLRTAEALSSMYPLERSRVVPTFADIARSSTVVDQAADAAALPQAARSDYATDAILLPESLAVEIRVTGPERAGALALTQQVLAESSERFASAYRIFEVQPLVPPRAQEPPTATVHVRAGAVSLLLGLLVGTGLVLLAQRIWPVLSGAQLADLLAPPAVERSPT